MTRPLILGMAGWLSLLISFSAKADLVVSIYPLYSIVHEIVGDNLSVSFLVPPRTSPHTYSMKPSDAVKLQKASLLFYVAPTLDEWVTHFPNTKRLEVLPLIPDNFILRNFGHVDDSGATVDTPDPHFWVDPLAVQALLPNLVSQLCKYENSHCTEFQKNSDNFSKRLSEFNDELKKLLEPIQQRSVVLSHPFFRYFFKRYDFPVVTIVQPVEGKAETPKDLKRSIEVLKTKKVKAVFAIFNLPEQAAKTAAETAKVKFVVLDPYGGIEGRKTYFEILRYNANLIREAL